MGQIDAQAKEEHPFSIDVKGGDKTKNWGSTQIRETRRQGNLIEYQVTQKVEGLPLIQRGRLLNKVGIDVKGVPRSQ